MKFLNCSILVLSVSQLVNSARDSFSNSTSSSESPVARRVLRKRKRIMRRLDETDSEGSQSADYAPVSQFCERGSIIMLPSLRTFRTEYTSVEIQNDAYRSKHGMRDDVPGAKFTEEQKEQLRLVRENRLFLEYGRFIFEQDEEDYEDKLFELNEAQQSELHRLVKEELELARKTKSETVTAEDNDWVKLDAAMMSDGIHDTDHKPGHVIYAPSTPKPALMFVVSDHSPGCVSSGSENEDPGSDGTGSKSVSPPASAKGAEELEVVESEMLTRMCGKMNALQSAITKNADLETVLENIKKQFRVIGNELYKIQMSKDDKSAVKVDDTTICEFVFAIQNILEFADRRIFQKGQRKRAQGKGDVNSGLLRRVRVNYRNHCFNCFKILLAIASKGELRNHLAGFVTQYSGKGVPKHVALVNMADSCWPFYRQTD